MKVYVLNRIFDLSEASDLMEVRYNKGGKYIGGDWSPQKPTDSHIVMWLFATIIQ